MANLRFFSAPSWQNKDYVGTLHTSEGYIIDAKVRVNELRQYKVHNSKGNIYYITVNEAYVYVK
nr:hypothetical protein [Bacillus cereus]